MVAVNQKSVLGSLIPDIYIKKITLTAGGKLPEERNPHIDHEREPNVVRNNNPSDPNYGKLERIPLDPIDMRKKSKEEAEPMSVDVELLLKEKLDNGIVASWFGNQDFLKYLKIQIIQSRNEEFTNRFATKELSLNVARILEVFESKFGNPDGFVSKEFPVKSALTESDISKHTTFTDDDGNVVHDIVFRVTFNVANSDPQHLSYFALSYLDVYDLAKDYDLDLPSNMERRLDGRIASEIVINDYDLVSETFIFLDERGQVWTGPVHQLDNGRWKTGDHEKESGKFLELTTIPNSKVQDFRDVKDIERLQLDFSIIENEILGRDVFMKRLTNDRQDVDRKYGYLTDASISRDSNGNVRFLFGLDFAKIIRDNTVFGKLYRDDNEELFENVHIHSLLVKRIRVNPDQKSLKDERGVSVFSKGNEVDEVPETIVVSGEKKFDSFTEINNDIGSLREVKIELEERRPGVRFFTGMDKTMDTVTFGMYQYGVEVEIEDVTTTLISDMVDDLLEAHFLLKEYWNEASSLDNFNVESNQFNQKYIKQKETEIDVVARSIREEEPEIDQEESQKRAIARMSWVLPVSVYLGIMDVLVENFDRNRFERSLLSYIHPRTGNPNGIGMVVKLVEHLVRRLSSVVGAQITGKVNKWIPGQKQARPHSTLNRGGGSSVKTFKIEKFFADLLDADAPKKVGYDFLSSGDLEAEDNEDGLKVVSNIKYQKRTEIETLKFFKKIDTDINMKSDKLRYTVDDTIENSRYSYLTPSNIQFGNMNTPTVLVNRGEKIFDSKEVQQIASGIMRFNMVRNSPRFGAFLPQIQESSTLKHEEQILKNNLSSMFGFRNLIAISPRIARLERTALEDVSTASEDKEEFVGVEESFGTGSAFNREDFVVNERGQRGVGEDLEEKDASNPNNVMLKIIDPLLDEGSLDASLIKTRKEELKFDYKNKIDLFDLTKTRNALDLIKERSSLERVQDLQLDAVNDSLVEQKEQVSQDDSTVSLAKQETIKALPNQIKSIALSSVKQNVTVKNWFIRKDFADPLRDVRQKLVFKMNYNIINKIEVLTGFKQGTNKNAGLQIKDGIWKRLTPEIFNKSKEKNLLCRQVEYQNNEFGIKKPKSFDLPTYNKYFILSPEEQIVTPAIIHPLSKRQFISDNLVARHAKQIRINPEFTRSLITARTMMKSKELQTQSSFNVFRIATKSVSLDESAVARSSNINVSRAAIIPTRGGTAAAKAKSGPVATKLFKLR